MRKHGLSGVAKRDGCVGFTIVELLVVVAIIAVLVAILLPSLSSGKNSANLAVCTSNVKGLINAHNQTSADLYENKFYPRAVDVYSEAEEDVKSIRELGTEDLKVVPSESILFRTQRNELKGPKNFICPDDDGRRKGFLAGKTHTFSYVRNGDMEAALSTGGKVRVGTDKLLNRSLVSTPGSTALILEKKGFEAWEDETFSVETRDDTLSDRHNGKTVIGWMSGSATPVVASELNELSKEEKLKQFLNPE